jgi:CRISPR-associated protein Csb2
MGRGRSRDPTPTLHLISRSPRAAYVPMPSFVDGIPPEEVFDRGSCGQGLTYGFTIEFAQDIAGPLNLGYGCHFGLGLFIPATA